MTRERAAMRAVFDVELPEEGAYPDTLDGFNAMLWDAGVKNFTAKEMTHGGNLVLLPIIQSVWDKGVLLARFAQSMRDMVAEPVSMRWWFRTPAVNQAVGGAPASDHLTASAVDLDFQSRRSLEVARKKICEPLYATGLFNMSLGVGARTIHLGFWSPNGHRRWWYKSYGKEPEKAGY